MVLALLLGLGFGVVMFALIAALAIPMQRWADNTGALGDKPQAPLGKQLQLIAFICITTGLGTGFLLAASDGPRWLMVPGFLLYGVMIVCAAIFGYRLKRFARPVRRPAAQPDIAHYTGLQRFFRCTIPRLALDNGRAFGGAVAMPPTGIVLIAVGKTWIGAGLLVFGVIAWILLLRLPPRNPPRRGPCAPS